MSDDDEAYLHRLVAAKDSIRAKLQEVLQIPVDINFIDDLLLELECNDKYRYGDMSNSVLEIVKVTLLETCNRYGYVWDEKEHIFRKE